MRDEERVNRGSFIGGLSSFGFGGGSFLSGIVFVFFLIFGFVFGFG